MATVDTSLTLQSLPRRLLQEIFRYNFPVNMLRAVATCQNLHGTLAKQLNNAVRFRKTEWVILGEIEAADFNNRVGQILGVQPMCCAGGWTELQVAESKDNGRIHKGHV